MTTEHVDVSFPVHGKMIPRDHGYALYGALSRAVPTVHGAEWLAIHGISAPVDGAALALERGGRLRVRAPLARLGDLLSLVGSKIEVLGRQIDVGAPIVHPLVPAAVLDARLVVIRLTGGVRKPFDRVAFEERFMAEARRQLVVRDVRGEIVLCGRQSLRVGGQRVIGYSVRVAGLSADDSLKLQVEGLGGKRTMGCGIFRPARIKQQIRQVA